MKRKNISVTDPGNLGILYFELLAPLFIFWNPAVNCLCSIHPIGTVQFQMFASFFFNFIATLFIHFSIFGCVGSSVRARAFSSHGKRGPLFIAVQGPLFIAVRGPLTIAAPPAAGHRLQTRRLSSCGSRAQPLRGMWDPPRPGLEPVSPAPAGRLSTTAPPGKPVCLFFTLG